MDEPTVLRTTKIGGGFVKEDVMQYLDELNSKIISIQEENEKLKKAGSSNSNDDEVRRYKNQVENLQEKLNAANNAHRAAKKELEAAKETIARLQAGKPVAAGSAPAPAVDTAQLDAAKKEIETLKNQLKAAQTAPAGQPVNNNDAAELAKAKQDLARMSGELAARAKAVDEKTRESAAKDAKIAQLTKDNAAALAKKDEELAKKNAELAKKDEEIKDLAKKASENSPTAMVEQTMMFCNSLKETAQKEADAIKKESSEKAEKVISDAKAEAEKTVSAANTTAESCIKDANIKAKTTIDEANKHADTVNEMSSTVRNMLLNEIKSISDKFSDISARLDEAENVVSEARKSIDTNASHDIKKMEAPKVDMSDVKATAEKVKTPAPAPKAPERPAAVNAVKPDNIAKPANNKPAPAPAPVPVQPKTQPAQPKKPVMNMDGMDDIMKSFSVKPQAETPAPAPAPAQPKPQPKKAPIMGLGDDMADLLKAIEADPNNIGE